MQRGVNMILPFIKRLLALLRPSNNTSTNSLSFHVGTHVGRMWAACGDGSGAHESGGGRDEKEKCKSE